MTGPHRYAILALQVQHHVVSVPQQCGSHSQACQNRTVVADGHHSQEDLETDGCQCDHSVQVDKTLAGGGHRAHQALPQEAQNHFLGQLDNAIVQTYTRIR